VCSQDSLESLRCIQAVSALSHLPKTAAPAVRPHKNGRNTDGVAYKREKRSNLNFTQFHNRGQSVIQFFQFINIETVFKKGKLVVA
jgi:hypothetical protein